MHRLCLDPRIYLIVPALSVAGVWWLVADQHVIEIHPGEGGDRFSVVGQMSNETLRRRLCDVEHQHLFGCLIILCIQRRRGEWSQDKLVHLQDEHRHKGRIGWLIGHSVFNGYRDPGVL